MNDLARMAFLRRMKHLNTFVFLLLFFLYMVGCSSFHEVAVVSHGEDVSAEEEMVSDETSLPPSVAPIEAALPEAEEVAQLDTQPLAEIPPNSVVVAPAERRAVEKDISSQSAADTTLPWTLQDVFFDFDQFAIRPDAIPILEQNAQILIKRYADRKVLIQGHCDERGTEAYNFVLGKRRATAVQNYLVNLGVAPSRLSVLSLGKNQPFCLERTIPCFRQNRRAHFVLK